MFPKIRGFLRDVWALARPYWTSEERWAARGLLFVIVVLALGQVFIEVLLNDWNRQFFNAIQEKNFTEFLHLMLRFGHPRRHLHRGRGLSHLSAPDAADPLRRWLTDRYVGRWLGDRAYYRLQLTSGATDNPDQRIAEDVRDFVESSLVMSLGLLNSVVTFVSFASILWVLSGSLTIPIAGMEIAIPGYMLWVALIYAVIGTWLTHLIGRPLIGLNFNQQRFEADFRFSLVRFRENAESIALYAGEARERRAFGGWFAHVVDNWWAIMRRTKYVGFFTNMYGQLAIIFPYLVAAPRYFFGPGQLGELTQTAGAFNQVQNALSWFVDAYTSLAAWKATVDRLTTFSTAIARVESPAEQTPSIRIAADTTGRNIGVKDLDLALPNGQLLLPGVNLTLRCRRVGAVERAVGQRQEHAVPGDLGHLAVRRRDDRTAGRGPAAVPAAKTLSADRQPARGADLPGRRATA